MLKSANAIFLHRTLKNVHTKYGSGDYDVKKTKFAFLRPKLSAAKIFEMQCRVFAKNHFNAHWFGTQHFGK